MLCEILSLATRPTSLTSALLQDYSTSCLHIYIECVYVCVCNCTHEVWFYGELWSSIAHFVSRLRDKTDLRRFSNACCQRCLLLGCYIIFLDLWAGLYVVIRSVKDWNKKKRNLRTTLLPKPGHVLKSLPSIQVKSAKLSNAPVPAEPHFTL